MTTQIIMQLITLHALMEGVPPQTALAIAKIESSYNVNAVGAAGELGLYQIMPQYSKYNKKDLKKPHINIAEGMRMLKEAKKNCVHQEDNMWVLCYNLGVAGAKKIKHPKKFIYYKKYIAAKSKLIKDNNKYASLSN